MKVSVVMTYHNRRRLLISTLKTIATSSMRSQLEVIVVDDGSNEEQRIEALNGISGLVMKIIRIEPENKTWHNSCVPFNMGFEAATGDIIIYQNAECLHMGDVVKYAAENINEGKYISFACYSADIMALHEINKVNMRKPDYISKINAIIQPTVNAHPANDCLNGWYCHSMYNPCAFHFCAAISQSDLKALGGFDNRYAGGLAYEDMEIIRRIRGRGMSVKIIDEPFVVHQAHEPTDYAGKRKYFLRNQHLYHTGQILDD